MKRIVVLALAVCWWSLLSVPAHVSVSVKIDSTAMLIGQQAHIDLKVVSDKGQHVTFPAFAGNRLTKGIEVLKQNISANEDLNNGQQKAITKTYTITSFDSALYYIPPFQVRVDNKVYTSKSLALKVVTMDIDTLHLDKFFGPKDIADVPFSWNDWKGLFGLSLLLILLLLVLGYITLQLHNRRPILRKFRIKPTLPPHQWAMIEIKKINKEKEVSEDTKAYYTRLTDILRIYIKKRYGFNAKEMTSNEIIEELNKQQDQKSIDELRQLFTTADLVKFAKFRTLLNENDENLLRAMDFIKATQLDVKQMPQKAPEIPPEVKRSRNSRLLLKILTALLIIGSLTLLCLIGLDIYHLFY